MNYTAMITRVSHIEGMNGEKITHREVEAALQILPMEKSPEADYITADMRVAA